MVSKLSSLRPRWYCSASTHLQKQSRTRTVLFKIKSTHLRLRSLSRAAFERLRVGYKQMFIIRANPAIAYCQKQGSSEAFANKKSTVNDITVRIPSCAKCFQKQFGFCFQKKVLQFHVVLKGEKAKMLLTSKRSMNIYRTRIEHSDHTRCTPISCQIAQFQNPVRPSSKQD